MDDMSKTNTKHVATDIPVLASMWMLPPCTELAGIETVADAACARTRRGQAKKRSPRMHDGHLVLAWRRVGQLTTTEGRLTRQHGNRPTQQQ